MLLTLRSQYGSGVTPRAAADAVISALSPAAWYRNATDVVSSGGFASIWADYASSDKGLVLPGVAGNKASIVDSPETSLTGDIEIIFRASLQSYSAPAFHSCPVSKLNATTGYCVRFSQGTGVMSFVWGDGAGLVGATGIATGFAANSIHWFKATIDVSNGSSVYEVKFWTADDTGDSQELPSSWTQLGSTITGGAAATIADGAQGLMVGEYQSASNPMSGVVYRAIVKDGIDGTTVFDADFSAEAIGTASFTESSSNAATVTINTSGARPAHIGKARDLLQGTGTNQPAYSAGVFTFDGADNWIRASTWSMVQPESVLIVGTQQTWTSGDSLCDGTTGNVMRLYQNNVTPQLFQYAGSSVSQNGGLSLNTRGIVLAVFNGASSSIRINNNAKTTGNAGAANGGGITVGAFGDTLSSFAHMTAEEIIVFPSALSDANQDAVITALNNALTVF